MKVMHILDTSERVCFTDITSLVQKTIYDSKIKEGTALVFVPHTTAGVMINENGDSDVLKDLKFAFEKIVPNKGFLHYEGNSDSHTKSLLTSCSLSLIISDSKLVLGTWQSVYFAEYDGPRTRKIYIKIMEG